MENSIQLWFILLLFIWKFGLVNNNFVDNNILDLQCEPVIGECADLGYEYTSLSGLYNSNNVASQKSADATIKSFEILFPCSNYLKIFLCATYKPSGHQEAALLIRPCQSMCEHVYSRCFPLMNRFKKRWSHELNCSRFLEDKSESCMKDKGYIRDLPQTSQEYIRQIDFLFNRIGLDNPDLKKDSNYAIKPIENKNLNDDKIYRSNLNDDLYENDYYKEINSNSDNFNTKNSHLYEKYICYSQHVNQNFKKNLNFKLNTSVITFPDTNLKCSLKCGSDILFNQSEKELVRTFTLILSSLCLASSILTILTFYLKSKDCQYPNVVFIFMSISYIIYCITYLISLNISKEYLTCQRLDINQLSNQDPNLISPYSVVRFETFYIYLENVFENNYCAATLLVAYYFKMASLSWWFIITISWFMLVQFDFDSDRITKTSGYYFHFIAWTIPGLKTVLIIVTRTGDISELCSMCSVNAAGPDSLFKYQIVPSSLYLII